MNQIKQEVNIHQMWDVLVLRGCYQHVTGKIEQSKYL